MADTVTKTNLSANRAIRICGTRALKNAKAIRKFAPHLIPPQEPLEGFRSLVPLDILRRFHRMSERELAGFPELVKVKRALHRPIFLDDAPFKGTLYFVQMTFFTEADHGTITVNGADVEKAIEYAWLAVKPISIYASQYGANRLDVSPKMLQFGVAVTNTRYNDDGLQNFVNSILDQNHLDPGSSCIVILNPLGMTNTDGDRADGIEGYHAEANAPYCFVNLYGTGLTVQDTQDFYADTLSHEIAEMTCNPDASYFNDEVCDACAGNCKNSWRNFFIEPNSYVQSATDPFPPAFPFTFFIASIVTRDHSEDCPAPESACNYGPPIPAAAGNPTAYVFAAQGTQHVVYRAADNRIIELWWNASRWQQTDATTDSGAPNAIGDPAGYMFEAQGTQHVVYRAADNHIHELWSDNSGWHHTDPTADSGAPNAVGDPAGYVFDAQGTQHVMYRAADNHIHELWWDANGWHHHDPTGDNNAPDAVGDPAGYVFAAQGTQHVMYRGADNHIYELWWDANGWHHHDPTGDNNAPNAAGNPAAYVFATQGTQHVVYRAADNHICELWWNASGWNHTDATTDSGAPNAVGDPAGYMFEAQGTQHVVYRAADNHIHELWWDNSGWHHTDPTADSGAPNAVGDPAGYVFDAQGTQHVMYRAADNHIHELWWDNSGWHHTPT